MIELSETPPEGITSQDHSKLFLGWLNTAEPGASTGRIPRCRAAPPVRPITVLRISSSALIDSCKERRLMYMQQPLLPETLIWSRRISYLLVMLIATTMLGCDAAVETFGGAAFSLIEEIEERNADAAQARIDLKPRPDAERSVMESKALQLANESLGSDNAKVKDAFCGSPPDLTHLPPEFFKFEPSVHIPEDTPKECRAAVDRKYPGLASCYLVFENGSTGYINCYNQPDSTSVACMSVKKLMWDILWNEELRKDCPKNESEAGA
jgi:hypothetical protein